MICNDSKIFLTFNNKLLVIKQVSPFKIIFEKDLTFLDPFYIGMGIQNNKLFVNDGYELSSYVF